MISFLLILFINGCQKVSYSQNVNVNLYSQNKPSTLLPTSIEYNGIKYKGFNLSQYRYLAKELSKKLSQDSLIYQYDSLTNIQKNEINNLNKKTTLLDKTIQAKDSIIVVHEAKYSNLEKYSNNIETSYKKETKNLKNRFLWYKIASSAIIAGLTYWIITK